jgi:hypothetical protein
MFKKAIDALRKAVDPRGPASNVITTDSFFKDRAGLPFEVGLRQRAELRQLPASEIEKALAPERYYAKGEIDVPYSRERVVTPYILERYLPVMEGMTIVGWRVVQEARSQFCDCRHAVWEKEGDQRVHLACGRRRAPLTDAEVIEKALTVQMQPSDAYFEGYAISIPGKDTAVLDGQVVTGGTYVQSRKHHRTLTKDFVFWDKGTPREVDRAMAEQKKKREAKLARDVERKAHRLVSDHPGDI